MKKIGVIILMFLVCININSQESVKQKEIGILFKNLDEFGLRFKFGANNARWRISTMFLNSGNGTQTNPNYELENKNFGVNFRFGGEVGVPVNENYEFSFGFEGLFGYAKNEYKSSKTTDPNYFRDEINDIKNIGVNIIFGFSYLVNDKIIIGAELLPNYTRTFKTQSEKNIDGTVTKTEYESNNFSVKNSAIELSISYRF